MDLVCYDGINTGWAAKAYLKEAETAPPPEYVSFEREEYTVAAGETITLKAVVRGLPSSVKRNVLTNVLGDGGKYAEVMRARATGKAAGSAVVGCRLYWPDGWEFLAETQCRVRVVEAVEADDFVVAVDAANIRAEPSAGSASLGIVTRGTRLKMVLPRETVFDGERYDWVKVRVTIAGAAVTGWIPEEFIGKYEEPSLPQGVINAMMINLWNDTTLPVSSDRRESMVIMGDALLKEGFEPAFVAGMLGNIQREGSFGQFEMAEREPYTNSYLRYFVNNHDYLNRFSGKLIHNIDITPQELYEMTSNSPNDTSIFGLGVAQWTYISRFFPLVNCYIEVTGGGKRRITSEEVVVAETQMMIRELSEPGDFVNIYPNWKAANSAALYSLNAAYDAASRLCLRYLIPGGAQTKAVQRGNDAKDIYRIMTS